MRTGAKRNFIAESNCAWNKYATNKYVMLTVSGMAVANMIE